MFNLKEKYRKELLTLRNALSLEEVAEKSKIICEKLINLGEFKKAEKIFTYYNSKNEVMTEPIIKLLIGEGKTVCLPFADAKTRQLEFYKVDDLNADLSLGSYGILEPVRKQDKRVFPAPAELLIIPGVGFDARLNRLGYGKGYFDNYLSRLPSGITKIGLAFDFQVVESIPTEEHDVKMDMIITEKRIIRNSSSLSML